MKRWACLLLMLFGSGHSGAQTVGDKPTRFMMIVGTSVTAPLKTDLLGGMGRSRVLPGLSGGLHYYFNENWGIGWEVKVSLTSYRSHNRKESFYRRDYIPVSYREMELKRSRQTLETSFVAGGVFYRKNVGRFWLEAGLLAGTIIFDAPSGSSQRLVYYKEEGTNFIHQHAISGLNEIQSFAVSPQISAQCKLNSRLGLALNVGVLQPFRRKLNYTLTLTDVFYQEDKVVESLQGKVSTPMLYSRLALILNFKAIGGRE